MMKIQIGNVPKIPDFDPEAESLHTISGPNQSASFLIAGLTGIVLLICPTLVLCYAFSFFAIPNPDPVQGAQLSPPWEAIVPTLLFYIPFHELMHLVWHPQMGTSDQSILVLWPSKLRFGVYYEGSMSRTRWLIMRGFPFVALSLVPAAFLSIFQNVPFNNFLRTSLEVLMVVNGAGSGGDVIAMLLVLFQVPQKGEMCFRGGRAYWRTGAPEGASSLPTVLK
ncbi:MAG: DUF3267 domain-containing protein [Anaerolineales bacterium]|nr:DUF3267 domain-containing protein [Anaerolineales bacterium]